MTEIYYDMDTNLLEKTTNDTSQNSLTDMPVKMIPVLNRRESSMRLAEDPHIEIAQLKNRIIGLELEQQKLLQRVEKLKQQAVEFIIKTYNKFLWKLAKSCAGLFMGCITAAVVFKWFSLEQRNPLTTSLFTFLGTIGGVLSLGIVVYKLPQIQ